MQLKEKIQESLPGLGNYVRAVFSRDVLAKLPVEDIVQETYARAVTAIDSFEYRSDQQLSAWLKQIARNVVISAIRKSDSKNQSLLCEFLLESGFLSPSKVMAKAEADSAVRNAVSQLDEDYQTLLKRRYENGEKFVDIAVAMGISPGAVRGQHRTALKKLLDLLESGGLFSTFFSNARTNSDKTR